MAANPFRRGWNTPSARREFFPGVEEARACDEDSRRADHTGIVPGGPLPAERHFGPGRNALNERDPDAELVARIGAGDNAAVRALVARKLPRLVALGTRLLGDRAEAEDIAQEVFVRIWKQASNWHEGQARFDTWMHRVALNLCYTRLRSRHEEPMAEVPEEADMEAEPARRLEARARGDQVRQALAALPVRQREALVLSYYQELPNLEAAAVMDISVEALESLLTRARHNLRARMESGTNPGKETP